MNWYSVGLAAASGALAALVATLVFGHKTERKLAFGLAFAVLFLVFNTLSKHFMLPQLNAFGAKSDFEKVVRDTPVFQSIREYEPETYASLEEFFVEAVRRGEDKQKTIDGAREKISSVIVKRLPKASDAAVAGYMSVLVEQMSALHDQGGGLCFKYLFPQVEGGIDAPGVFSSELLKRDMEAMDLAIRSYDETRGIPTEAEVIPLLQPLYAELYEAYGDGVSVLSNPAAENVDRERLCDITRALYAGILGLEPDQSVKVLRWMLAQG
jgi:hypothetical protein